MIVISGALVLVALVLLIVGITVPELTYVYASILVSLVSFAFLLIGILQRRGDKGGDKGGDKAVEPSSAASAPQASEREQERTVSVVPAPVRTRGSVVVGDEPAPPAAVEQSAEDDADDDDDEYDDEVIDPADDRAVLIVEGRPRYHAEGCRYLSGKKSEVIHLLDARDEGYTPCGVCKPDNVVAVEEGLAVVPAEEGVEPVVEVVPASSVGQAADQAPAGAAGASDSGTVVIIPDRGRFHRAACRYVRNATDTRTRTRPQAVTEGYVPCGVCKP